MTVLKKIFGRPNAADQGAAKVLRGSAGRSQEPLLIGYARDHDIKALFELLGIIVRSGGSPTQNQMLEIERLISDQVPTSSRALAMSCFREGTSRPVTRGNVTVRAFQLYGFQAEGPADRWLEPMQVLNILLRLAMIDRTFSNEAQYLIDAARATLGVQKRSYWILRDSLAERFGVTITDEIDCFARGSSSAERSHAFRQSKADSSSNSRAKEDQQRKKAPPTMTQKEAFAFLELEPSADRREIKIAYRALVKRYHPDLLNPNLPELELKKAVERFCQVQQAYEMLSLE